MIVVVSVVIVVVIVVVFDTRVSDNGGAGCWGVLYKLHSRPHNNCRLLLLLLAIVVVVVVVILILIAIMTLLLDGTWRVLIILSGDGCGRMKGIGEDLMLLHRWRRWRWKRAGGSETHRNNRLGVVGHLGTELILLGRRRGRILGNSSALPNLFRVISQVFRPG